MSSAELLTLVNILVAFLGVLVVILAAFEWLSLRRLRRDLRGFKAQWYREQRRLQKAQQRVIASYGVGDLQQRIDLLRSAVEEDPQTFNGYNALGYAYLEQGDRTAAVDAFKEAIRWFPDAKEGYFDLARAYLQMGKTDLCRKYLAQVVKLDPAARRDIDDDPRLSQVFQP